MVRRLDILSIDGPKKTPEGFIVADANLTRTGVFEYRNADGSTRRELRLAEDVFAPESLASFDGKPLTLDHPGERVTSANVRKYQRGHVSSPSRHADGKHVAAKVIIQDAEAVAAVDAGKSQLSNGYDCDPIPLPGGKYTHPDGRVDVADFVQKNIVGNHIAIVARGRAGPSSSIRFDALEDEPTEETKGMTPEEKARLDKLEADLKTALASVASEKARADAAQAAADLAKKDAADNTARLDRLDAEKAIAAKADLLGRAVAILGKDRKDALAALDAKGIRLELAKSAGLSLDGKPDAYVEAIADSVLAKPRTDSADLASRAALGVRPVTLDAADTEASKKLREARKAHEDAVANAWSKPQNHTA